MREVRESAARYVERLHEPATPVIVPALLVPEAAAAVCRGTGDGALAGAFVSLVQRLPNLVWVGLDALLARQAAEYSLRGCDAVYAAVARRFGSVLVTLGRGQLERAAVAVETQTPRQAMRHLGR